MARSNNKIQMANKNRAKSHEPRGRPSVRTNVGAESKASQPQPPVVAGAGAGGQVTTANSRVRDARAKCQSAEAQATWSPGCTYSEVTSRFRISKNVTRRPLAQEAARRY